LTIANRGIHPEIEGIDDCIIGLWHWDIEALRQSECRNAPIFNCPMNDPIGHWQSSMVAGSVRR
jgi:hypothetical protein